VVLDDSMMRRSDALREMMRLARAIVADGQVTEAEARTLRAWIERNSDVEGIAAVDDIVGVLTDVLADERLSEPEKSQVAELLKEFGG
jgi:hypothetical protein